MKRNIFINIINKNWLLTFFEEKKDFYKSLKSFLEKELKVEINKVYLCSDKIFLENWKIITEYNDIKFITTKNFNYILKQFSTNNTFNKWSIILTSNIWDYYLLEFWIDVYTLEYKGNLSTLRKVIEKDIYKKIEDLKINQYLDYLILQEKNNDSVWQKRTISLLKEYWNIESLILEIDNLEDERVKWILKYQILKFKYFLYLKNFFITFEDLN